MTTTSNKPTRPGLKQGPTSEFTIFFKVKAGHAQQLREFLDRPGGEKERTAIAARIPTLHDLRWVLFDDDTRLLFATEFDGDWDAYIDDFAAGIPDLFDDVLQHVEGYPGIKDPKIKDYILAHQETASVYFRTYEGTATEIKKALGVQEAFQHLLDQAS